MEDNKIPVLVYHDISHDISNAENPWCVPPEEFEAQLLFLATNGYRSISLDELQEIISEGKETGKAKETGKKPVAITFDDARKGVYQYAFPLLKKHGFTAAVFVVPAWADGNDVPKAEQYSGFMSWDELREMQAAGFTIGSHSYAHRDLTKLPEAELQQELERAENKLREKLGLAVRHFAYPFGKWNQKLAEELGKRYSAALSTERGFSKGTGHYARQAVLRGMPVGEFSLLLSPPKLSVCMIVRNEEEVLGQSLSSVRGLAGEIIVIDTGSTDKSKEIARRFTSKVFDFSWNDDFAAAKNESIKHATGDWILVLDADEVISPKDYAAIQETIASVPLSVLACRLVLRNYTPDSRAAGWQPRGDDAYQESALAPGWWEVSKIRLFRNRKGLHFQGKIHESITDSLPDGAKVLKTDIPIHHYGKLHDVQDPERLRQKQELYERLEKKKAEEQGDFYAYFELGRQLVQNKKFPEAIAAFQESVRRKEDYFETWFMLGSTYLLQGERQKAQEALEKARSLEPKFAPVHANLGVLYAQDSRHDGALSSFRQALALNHSDAASWRNMARCLTSMGKKGEAQRAMQKAQELNPAYRKDPEQSRSKEKPER